MKHYEFWFVVGSQTLYGDDTNSDSGFFQPEAL